jgi:hypothetical protein
MDLIMDIPIKCSECGKELEATFTQEDSPEILVEPCERCMQAAADIAQEDCY